MPASHINTVLHNEVNPTTSCTITIPTVSAGDDLYVQACTRSASPAVTCTDDDTGGNLWTGPYAQDSANRIQFFHKKATSGSTGKTITLANAVAAIAAIMSVYRGGLAGDPTRDYQIEENLSGDQTHAGITPDLPDSMVCFTVFNHSGANVASNVLATIPSSLTIRGTQTSNPGGSSPCAVSHASAAQTGAPSFTGDFTWTQTSNGTKSLAWSIASQPTAVLSGTALAGITEADMVAGGKVISVTVFGDTVIP